MKFEQKPEAVAVSAAHESETIVDPKRRLHRDQGLAFGFRDDSWGSLREGGARGWYLRHLGEPSEVFGNTREPSGV